MIISEYADTTRFGFCPAMIVPRLLIQFRADVQF